MFGRPFQLRCWPAAGRSRPSIVRQHCLGTLATGRVGRSATFDRALSPHAGACPMLPVWCLHCDHHDKPSSRGDQKEMGHRSTAVTLAALATPTYVRLIGRPTPRFYPPPPGHPTSQANASAELGEADPEIGRLLRHAVGSCLHSRIALHLPTSRCPRAGLVRRRCVADKSYPNCAVPIRQLTANDVRCPWRREKSRGSRCGLPAEEGKRSGNDRKASREPHDRRPARSVAPDAGESATSVPSRKYRQPPCVLQPDCRPRCSCRFRRDSELPRASRLLLLPRLDLSAHFTIGQGPTGVCVVETTLYHSGKCKFAEDFVVSTVIGLPPNDVDHSILYGRHGLLLDSLWPPRD